MEGHRLRVGALAWSSTLLSSGGRDKSIFQRDMRAQGDFVSKLSGHKSEVKFFNIFFSLISFFFFFVVHSSSLSSLVFMSAKIAMYICCCFPFRSLSLVDGFSLSVFNMSSLA
jgi:hypothetical protein